MKKIMLVAMLICLAGAAHAESPKWDFVSLSYLSVDIESDKYTGFGLSGSKLVSENVFLAASYGQVSDNVNFFGESVKVELSTLSLGLGYRHALAPNTDFFTVISYVDVEAKASYMGASESVSDNGYSLQGGLRSMVSNSIELIGSLSYVSIDGDSDTSVGVEAQYHVNNQLSFGLGYSIADDADTASLSLYLYF